MTDLPCSWALLQRHRDCSFQWPKTLGDSHLLRLWTALPTMLATLRCISAAAAGVIVAELAARHSSYSLQWQAQ